MVYNQTLSEFRKLLRDNSSLLKINSTLNHVFKEEPVVAYRSNKKLKDTKVKQQSNQKTEANIKSCLL